MPRTLLFLALPLLLAAEDDPGRALAFKTAKALYDGITTAELDNGLRVYLKPVKGSVAVTTVLAYKAGSCDEDKASTGLAHYLEHLLFKGTKKLKPGDIDRLSYRVAGSNNAYTSADLTAYHFTVPAGKWRVALEIEADRMRNTVVDKAHEFDKEKGAVINELAGGEDKPWDLEYKALLPLLFGKSHPYGHPVIGEKRHVADADEKTITGFYDKWYHPNNAALVLVGGFDPGEAMAAIKELFGGIPRAKLPERKALPKESPRLPARAAFKSKFSQPRLLWAVQTVPSGHEDHAALTVLDAVLGAGKRSRLYRALVEGTALASNVSTSHDPGRYPGWMGLYIDVLPGKDRDAVERALLVELAKVAEKAPGEAELKRVKQQLLAAFVFSREGTYGLAKSISESVILNDLGFARKQLPAILAVTGDDMRRVAKKYLARDRSAVVWSIPGGKGKGGEKGDAKPGRKRRAEEKEAGIDLSKTRRVVLGNGLTVLLFRNPRLPVFEAHLSLREANLRQPDGKLGVASLMGTLLDEGTPTRTGEQIAEAIEGLGGDLSLSASGGSVKVLSPDWKQGTAILFDCLMNPAFPEAAFARNKPRMLAQVAEAEAEPDKKARQEFLKAVYGEHPLGRPALGTTKTVEALTRQDCVDFHKLVFVPSNAILAVAGDFDPDAVEKELEKLTERWKKADLKARELPKVARPAKFTEKVVTMPEGAQLHFYMGHAGIRRNDPDYHKLLVMDYILGTGPGFTDRLSSRLRDREGWAYTVSAAITSSAGVEPGRFACYIGTDPDKYGKVKKGFLEELRRIRKEEVGKTELADAKTYLAGSAQLEFATNGGIARQLLEIERYGLGLDYLAKYQKAVGAVTAEDILAVARKHLDPERMVVVAAGPVDEKGEPLKKK
ncbi:MAG: insulinase family protein [Gemmataceae bacterium]|nr:insulinase family protein [Gemmataceae bacterium]